MKRIAFWIVAFACFCLLGGIVGFVMHYFFRQPLLTAVVSVLSAAVLFSKVSELNDRWFGTNEKSNLKQTEPEELKREKAEE